MCHFEPCDNRGSRGFTFIQLLAVFVVLAVLAVVLFPVYSAAKKKASLATCLSNLRRIGTALTMYCNDYNGMLPAITDGHNIGGKVGISERKSMTKPRIQVGNLTPEAERVLNRYVKNMKVWQCPSGRNWSGWGRDYDIEGTSYLFSQAYNLDGWLEYTNLRARNLNKLRYPARLITVGERGIHEYCGRTADKPMGFRSHDRRKATAAVIFADGRASYIMVTHGLWDGWVNLSTPPGKDCKWMISQPEWVPKPKPKKPKHKKPED